MTDLKKLDPPTNPYAPVKITLEMPDNERSQELDLTEEEADEVLKDANLSRVNIRSIRNYRKIGKYLKKLGLVEYARGKLLGREEALERAREAMLRIVEGLEDAEVCDRVSAAQAVNALINTENRTLELGISLEKLQAEIQTEPKNRANLPPPGSVIHINTDNVNLIEKTPVG